MLRLIYRGNNWNEARLLVRSEWEWQAGESIFSMMVICSCWSPLLHSGSLLASSGSRDRWWSLPLLPGMSSASSMSECSAYTHFYWVFIFFFLIIPSLTSQEHRRVCFMSTLRTRLCWLRACSRENAKAVLTSFQGVDWWNKWGKTPRQKKCMEIPRVNENKAARAAEREKIDGGKEVDWGWWICC